MMPNTHSDEVRDMLRLSEFQAYFAKTYRPGHLYPEDAKEFDRDLNYLVHLIYREAQALIMKQMADYVIAANTPIVMEMPKTK